jgi:hypothetical protein
LTVIELFVGLPRSSPPVKLTAIAAYIAAGAKTSPIANTNDHRQMITLGVLINWLPSIIDELISMNHAPTDRKSY